MRKILAVLIALVSLASPALPQTVNVDEIYLYGLRDIDATAYEYCRYVGLGGGVEKSLPGPAGTFVSATAASTTVTGTNFAANIAAGDLIEIRVDGRTNSRIVTARASANSITINTALLNPLNVAAAVVNAPYAYRKAQCGTSDWSGAFSVTGVRSFSIHAIMSQEVSTSTDYQIQCRNAGPAAVWSIVGGPFNDASTFNDFWTTDLPFSECRVGVQVNTDDGDDLTTNAEQFTVNVQRRY